MSGRFDPADRHNDAIVEAIHAAAHRISATLKEGFQLMADETKALADLTDAVSAIGNAIANEIAALKTALANQGVDNSPAIETAVANLNNLTAGLQASLPGAPPATAAPTAPAAPTPGA